MKKAVLCLTILMLTTIVLLTVVSCSTQESEYYEKHPTQTTTPYPYTYDPNWTSVPQPTDANGVELPGDPYHYINPERLFNMGEWMDIAGVQIRLNSVEVTKKLGDMKLELMVSAGTKNKIDEEGTLYGNQSYVIMSIDISNQTEEAAKICVGDFGLYRQVLDERQVVTTFCYMEPSMYEGPDSSYYLMQPGKKITFTHYSRLVNDTYIDNKELYFHVPSWDISIAPVEEEDWYYGYAVWVPMNQDKSEVDVFANYQDERDYINPARIYNMGETVERDGMTFCVNNISEGKKLEGISVDRMRYANYTKQWLDSEGTFDSDVSRRHYMRVNITIRNLTEEERILCTGVIYLADPHAGGFTASSTTGITPSITTDLFYTDFYNFQPGEKVTFDLYYVCFDEDLTAENQVLYFPLSMSLQDAVNPESFYNNDFFVALKKDKSEVNIYGE